MAGTLIHLAIADKIYYILGDDVIKNLPLFSVEISLQMQYMRKKIIKERIKNTPTYAMVYVHTATDTRKSLNCSKNRVNGFIEKYYFIAGEDKDLYLGYIVHLLVDELEMFSAYERLEINLKRWS